MENEVNNNLRKSFLIFCCKSVPLHNLVTYIFIIDQIINLGTSSTALFSFDIPHFFMSASIVLIALFFQIKIDSGALRIPYNDSNRKYAKFYSYLRILFLPPIRDFIRFYYNYSKKENISGEELKQMMNFLIKNWGLSLLTLYLIYISFPFYFTVKRLSEIGNHYSYDENVGGRLDFETQADEEVEKEGVEEDKEGEEEGKDEDEIRKIEDVEGYEI